jgi:hypothetical protein
MDDKTYDTAKLLKQFDKHFGKVRSTLTARYGAAEADLIVARTRCEFEALAPRIPYIGGRANTFTPVMVINGWIVALYRAMKARGYDVEDVVKIAYEASDGFFRSLPPIVDRLVHWVASSRYAVRHLERQAQRSQERRYPEDFVYTCTARRRGPELELELEFTECAVQKYYEAEGVEELKPYCNFFDPIYSRYFGMGVRAEHTLGLGCSTCKLNFNNRRETRLPPNIERLVAK